MNKVKFKPEYCADLVEHLANGNTFKSFGGLIGVCKQTLHNWAEKHKDFAHAKDVGESKREKYMVDLGKTIATGQLRRVISEEQIVVDGQPIYDRKGKPVMRRVYAHVQGNPAIWIFMMKNMCKWADNKGLVVEGNKDKPLHIKHETDAMTDDELTAQAERLRAMRLVENEVIPDGPSTQDPAE